MSEHTNLGETETESEDLVSEGSAGSYAIGILCDEGCEPYGEWKLQHTEELAQFLLTELRIASGSDISVAFVGEVEIEALHVQWLDEPGPTDVMSFPMDELVPGDSRAGSLGDVVICGAVAQRQAVAAGHSTRDEVELLFTHGVLHLLGHDHQEPGEHEVMFGLQAQLLQRWREESTA